MADFGVDFITQRYLRRYPDSKRAKSWTGVMVHIQTENGVWRTGGSGYTWAGKPDAWILPFEDAVKQIDHCGPEKEGKFLRVETQPPAQNVRCPCTTFEQSEECPVGYPSLLCSACDGTGNAPIDKVVALAAEMMKIAEQAGEVEDPFAAWETIDLIKSQHSQLRKALSDMVPPKLTWKERDADGFLVHHQVAAINAARAALATSEVSTDA